MEDLTLLIMAFERDDPFTMDISVQGKCYFNKKTREVIWAGGEISSVEPTGSEWVIVPGTPHSEWHEVFREWLEEIDKYSYYTTSIGLTLKKLGPDYWDRWQSRKNEYAEQKAQQWIKKFSS